MSRRRRNRDLVLEALGDPPVIVAMSPTRRLAGTISELLNLVLILAPTAVLYAR